MGGGGQHHLSGVGAVLVSSFTDRVPHFRGLS